MIAVRVLLTSIDCCRFSTLFSPKALELPYLVPVEAIDVGIGMDKTKLNKASDSLAPNPSMSIAPRETKCRICSLS